MNKAGLTDGQSIEIKGELERFYAFSPVYDGVEIDWLNLPGDSRFFVDEQTLDVETISRKVGATKSLQRSRLIPMLTFYEMDWRQKYASRHRGLF